MESKITSYLFYMGLIAAVLAAVLTTVVFRSSFEEQRVIELSSTAGLLAKSYTQLENKEDILRYADDTLRLTLVEADGTVVCDSDADAAALENHADRPEIAQALASGAGSSVPCRSISITTRCVWRTGEFCVWGLSGTIFFICSVRPILTLCWECVRF